MATVMVRCPQVGSMVVRLPAGWTPERWLQHMLAGDVLQRRFPGWRVENVADT